MHQAWHWVWRSGQWESSWDETAGLILSPLVSCGLVSSGMYHEYIHVNAYITYMLPEAYMKLSKSVLNSAPSWYSIDARFHSNCEQEEEEEGVEVRCN